MGGLELFIIGKNFLKDTRVIFQARRSTPSRDDAYDIVWEDSVLPDKEFLQQVNIIENMSLKKKKKTIEIYLNTLATSIFRFQTHLVCVVPPYLTPDIVEPVTVQLLINSSNKYSEPHSFIYTPEGSHGAYGALAMATTMGTLQPHGGNTQSLTQGILIIFNSINRYIF